ncbi:Replication factor A [Vigna unguiculata]|uniref:Replication factor A n=2 Tax=Vigna unguiculata TaxID=3917 RepID=A0A4D6M050_VIGUN|nr:Replication factor A [Vigna unguiculata]
MFFCEKCNKHVIKFFPRYKVKIRVIDSSDSTTFVLFDRDATVLLNKGCANMLEGLDKEFAELVDKSLLFKVESRNDKTFKLEQSFKVKKVCFDDGIIDKFNDSGMKSMDLLKKFTNESTDSSPLRFEVPTDNPSTEDSNKTPKIESAKKVLSLDSIEEDNIPLKVLKQNIKKEK